MAKVKLPKRVVGVKIPKKVRKKANKALKLADSPMVREAAVAALGAAGVAKGAKEAAGGDGGRGGATKIDIDTVLEAARYAALEGLRRFFEGFEEGMRKASDVASDAADAVDDRPKRERSSARAN